MTNDLINHDYEMMSPKNPNQRTWKKLIKRIHPSARRIAVPKLWGGVRTLCLGQCSSVSFKILSIINQ
jgi:hypothetical protein